MNNLSPAWMNPVASISKTATLFFVLTATALAAHGQTAAVPQGAPFGPDNPFYAPSTLPFHAPSFDKIKDSDYQPAIDAGMAEQRKEVEAIAENPAPPTFENTLVALEKSGRLLDRVMEVFNCVTSANTDEALQKVQEYEAPRLAANQDAIYLNPELFARIKAVYDERASLHLDAGVAAAAGVGLQGVCARRRQSVVGRQGEAEKDQRGRLDTGERVPDQAAGGGEGRRVFDR